MRELEKGKVGVIARWLRSRLDDVEVDVYDDDLRMVTSFRANVPDLRPSPVLRVTLRVLEDLGVGAILEDLDRERVPERMLARPDMHLVYTTERRIPHFETLPIDCDGRSYRVVRGEDCHVQIFDDQDRLLANRGRQGTLPSSVFMRSDQEWCDEIRRGRGPGQ